MQACSGGCLFQSFRPETLTRSANDSGPTITQVGNRAIPQGDTLHMSFDVMEEGTPCDYCGQPVGFMDDDEAVCLTCRAEYINMDFEGSDLEDESPLEY